MADSDVEDATLHEARTRVPDQYGSQRLAVLRVLFTWLNLSIVLALTYPALVVVFGAPAVRPDQTPFGWFVPRVLVTIVVLGLAAWRWRLSRASGAVATPINTLAALVTRGIWSQVTIVLIGSTLIPAALLLISDPSPATRALFYGLLEALAVQTLILGFAKSTLSAVDSATHRVDGICLALFAGTFSMQSAFDAGVQSGAGVDEVLAALLAGVMIGGIFGGMYLYLLRRTGSLMPPVLLHWLLIAILPAYIDGL